MTSPRSQPYGTVPIAPRDKMGNIMTRKSPLAGRKTCSLKTIVIIITLLDTFLSLPSYLETTLDIFHNAAAWEKHTYCTLYTNAKPPSPRSFFTISPRGNARSVINFPTNSFMPTRSMLAVFQSLLLRYLRFSCDAPMRLPLFLLVGLVL